MRRLDRERTLSARETSGKGDPVAQHITPCCAPEREEEEEAQPPGATLRVGNPGNNFGGQRSDLIQPQGLAQR